MEIPPGFPRAVGRVENLGLVFQAFHGTGISTALLFVDFVFGSWLIRFRPGFLLVGSFWRVPRDNWECSVR